MKLTVKKIDFETGNLKDVVLNSKDAEKLGQKAGERIIVKNKETKSMEKKYWVGIVRIDYSGHLISEGEIGIFSDTLRSVANSDYIENVSVKPADPPESFKFIQKKVKGEILTAEEINSIIDDAVLGHLSNIDLAAFITGVEINGLNNSEMTSLTMAETKSGDVFNFGPNVFDKHSTGGVPGNKVSLIIVPIVAAAGLTIPKTSTRAITSPSGTADSMEVLANVAFESEEIKKLVSEVKACIVWG
ncbi:MAG: thymidine phosphorylase, partial [Promethearchaeia archaeon]